MSTTHNRLQNPPAEEQVTSDNSVSAAEAAALRAEKLADIKRAIESGAYDSDDLLEKAMRQMREAIENGKEPR